MKIINKVTNRDYIKWIEQFVESVIKQSQISCREVIIMDIEFGINIWLSIDGEKYHIRTWDFEPVKIDKHYCTYAEMVDYTLFKVVKDDMGSHGEAICNGLLEIEWEN